MTEPVATPLTVPIVTPPRVYLAFRWLQPAGATVGTMFLASDAREWAQEATRAIRRLKLVELQPLTLRCQRAISLSRGGFTATWAEVPCGRGREPRPWPVGLLALDEEIVAQAEFVWRFAVRAWSPESDHFAPLPPSDPGAPRCA